MHICVFSDKNDKVNNQSQEIHVITPYLDFEHIKGKDNVLEDSLLRLKTLGSHKAYDPTELGNEYGKSIFNPETETVCNRYNNQNVKTLKLMVSNISLR